MSSISAAIRAHTTLSLNLSTTFDCLSTDSLDHIRAGRTDPLYVAAAVDELGNSIFFEASRYLQYRLNHEGDQNPANRAKLVTVNFYRIRSGSSVLKPFCTQEQLANAPFYSAKIARYDTDLDSQARTDSVELLAACHIQGKGGARLSPRRGSHYIRVADRIGKVR